MDHVELPRAASEYTASSALTHTPCVTIHMHAHAATSTSTSFPSASACAANAIGAPVTAPLDVNAKPTLLAMAVPQTAWVPDEQASACPDCQVAFSLFNRKHHCRTCGGLFCQNCSSKTVNGNHGGQYRVCWACFHEHELVVSRYAPLLRADGTRQLRRRSRGKLKMCQLSLLVHIATFLPVPALSCFCRTSADFYFAARDNIVWDLLLKHRAALEDHHNHSKSAQQRSQAAAAKRGPDPMSPTTQSPTTTSMSLPLTLGKNYSSFMVYCRRVVDSRCEGISTYGSRVKQLFAGGIKITFLAPGSVSLAKAHLLKRFLGDSGGVVSSPVAASLPGGSTASRDSGSSALGASGSAQFSTTPAATNDRVDPLGVATSGFCVYNRSVRVSGGISTNTNCTVYDVASDRRYKALWRLCASQSHAVVLCYDSTTKMTLADAALIMEEVESSLLTRGQVVVMCGIRCHRKKAFEVATTDAEAASVRSRASIHVDVSDAGALTTIQATIQAVVDGLANVTAGRRVVERPTVLDILLDH